MNPIHIFYHIGAMNHYREVVAEQINLLDESNLLSNATLHVGKVGLGEFKDLLPSDKVEIMFDLDNINLGEGPTLNELQHFCNRSHELVNILYMHTKGVSDDNSKEPRLTATRDWRHMMEYFCISYWRQCIQKLEDGFNAVGCNWYTQPWPHFSGGFWWATSDTIKRLPPLQVRERLDCERFIGTGPVKNVYSFHNSNWPHYQLPYPNENYFLLDFPK